MLYSKIGHVLNYRFQSPVMGKTFSINHKNVARFVKLFLLFKFFFFLFFYFILFFFLWHRQIIVKFISSLKYLHFRKLKIFPFCVMYYPIYPFEKKPFLSPCKSLWYRCIVLSKLTCRRSFAIITYFFMFFLLHCLIGG